MALVLSDSSHYLDKVSCPQGESRMQMGAAAGPGDAGLASQLLGKLRHEGHVFKAYLGYRSSSMPAQAA